LDVPLHTQGMTSDGHCQASTFITKSDHPSQSSDHYTPSDALLEYDDSEPFEDPGNPPLDPDETAFMDLFIESESSQDIGNMVCDCLLPAAHLTNDLGYTSRNFHIYGSTAAAEILTLRITQFETLGLDAAADAGHLFETNDDVFTLAGLDDDWESINPQPNPTQRRENAPPDDYDLRCMALDLGASSTGFHRHASTRWDVPRFFYDLGTAASDQPVLDLDSDDEEMREEAVLDFLEA